MSTAQFKPEKSPFSQGFQCPPPKEDFVFLKHLSQQGLLKNEGTSNKRLTLALFGLGRAGTNHLINMILNPRVDIKYVVEGDEKRWTDLNAEWRLSDKNVKWLKPDNCKDVFMDHELMACWISTPTFTHEQLVRSALEANKAVFCEKPLAASSEATADLFKLASLKNLPLLCGFNRRFDPTFVHLQQRIQNGDVGHVQFARVCHRDCPTNPVAYMKTSGGIFQDSAVHDIDVLIWMLRELPDKIFTSAKAVYPEIKDIDDFDNVVINLQYPSGTIAVIDKSRFSSYGHDQRMEFFGSKGMVNAGNLLTNSVESFTACQSGNGSTGSPIQFSTFSRFADAFRQELDHFVQVVLDKVPIRLKDREVLAVSKITQAAEESARTGLSVDLKWSAEEQIN